MKKFLCITLFMGCGVYGFAQTFSLIADSIRKYRSVPGLVYAVFTTDEILDTGFSGVRIFKTRDNIQFTDHFNTGTNTTAFTAYLAARLVDAGKIKWNSSIISLLPELNGKTMKVYHKITLQQLLSQRGGVPDYADLEEYKMIGPLPGKTMSEQRRNFAMIALKRSPLLMIDSSTATYSMAGTAIAAAMMERATGKSWEELVELYINRPLNIHAGFGLANRTDSLQPYGHWDKYGSLTAEPGNSWGRFIPAVAPAADLHISAKDYIVFMQDMLRALNNKKSFISYTAAEQMLFGFSGYSMGWENETWRSWRISHYLGKDPLFSCYAEIIRDKNIGIVVLCNSGAANGRSVVLNFSRLLRDYYTR